MANALEFWNQLAEFSKRYIAALGNMNEVSPWGQEKFDGGRPKGAVIHYTADDDMDRVIAWFNREKYQARVSAHLVVGDRRHGSADKLLQGLPLVEALPVTVVQCRPPRKAAVHATWTNSFLYGIENVNAGELRQKDKGYVTWQPRDGSAEPWTRVWAGSTYKTPVMLSGRFWDPLTDAQIKANIMLLRYLNELYDGQLQPAWIIGHEQVQGTLTKGAGGHDKRDPGPSYPMNEVRDAVFGKDYDAVLSDSYARGRRNEYVLDLCDALALQSIDPRPGIKVAWERFESAIRALPGKPEFGVVGKCALRILGFHVSDPRSQTLDEHDKLSIWIFQKMMGLGTDGAPGPQTKQALVRRLEDRGYLVKV